MTVPHLSYTPDVIILGTLGLVIVYGLLLGRNKVKLLALAVYVGLVIGDQLGPALWSWVSRSHFGNGRLNQTNLQLGLFVLPLILLVLGRREHHGRGGHKGGTVMTLILCVLTAALVVSSGLALWNPSGLQAILSSSTLAATVYKLRLWWVGLVPLAVVGENFIRSKD